MRHTVAIGAVLAALAAPVPSAATVVDHERPVLEAETRHDVIGDALGEREREQDQHLWCPATTSTPKLSMSAIVPPGGASSE